MVTPPKLPVLLLTGAIYVNEGDDGTERQVTFVVRRTGPDGTLNRISSANWSLSGQADAQDFRGGVLPVGTVSFKPGSAAENITFWIRGDRTFEANEQVRVLLAGPVGCTIAQGSATLVIQNDDKKSAAPAPQPAPASAPPAAVPAPAPPTPPVIPGPRAAVDFATWPAGALGAQRLNEDFRHGYLTQDQGGVWRDREWTNGDDMRSLLQAGAEAQCLYASPGTGVGPQVLHQTPEGLRFTMEPITQADRATWRSSDPAIQKELDAKNYWSGRILTQHPQGAPEADRRRHSGYWPESWGWTRNEALPHFEVAGPFALSYRLMYPKLLGIAPARCGYSRFGIDGLLEYDFGEGFVFGDTYNAHQWPGPTWPSVAKISRTLDIGLGLPNWPEPEDGAPAPVITDRMVTYGFAQDRAGQMSWYIDGRRVKQWDASKLRFNGVGPDGKVIGFDAIHLDFALNARRGADPPWPQAGPLDPASVGKAWMLLESVQVWDMA